MRSSNYLDGLAPSEKEGLHRRLYDLQTGKCYICDEPIDLEVHKDQLDIDHIEPIAMGGSDNENNFALTHSHCNRSKGASDIRVARRLAEFENLQQMAREQGARGASLGDVLKKYSGAKARLRLNRTEDYVEFSFPEAGDNKVQRATLYKDGLSNTECFFAVAPLEYIHHDDRINPRSIGANVRGLIEEFLKKRPQLHVGLAWWRPEEDGAGQLKLFDGQHKAAAQIMLGIKELPVRVFVKPDVDVLVTTNTNAGSKLRQVAFDTAVMRHLGSTLYLDRVGQYRKMQELAEDDWSFSESDLVRFFRGEQREMQRYIVDAQRDAITHDKDNRLLEFVEWSGKSADRPIAYTAVERSFFHEFLYQKALDSPIDEGFEDGSNPRDLEREQMIRLMSLFADVFFVGKWDPDFGGRRIENRVHRGERIPEDHLRAWRIARAEVIANVMRWIRRVIDNYFAYTGRVVNNDRLLQVTLPDELWDRIEAFLENLSKLPCWTDKELSTTVFGPKQNLDYWDKVFSYGVTPNNIRVLAKGLNILEMINKGPITNQV